jgi:hypothetical protein
MAPQGTRAIRVEGQVPERQDALALRVVCGDLELGHHVLERGEFVMETPVPESLRGGAFLFELRAGGGRWAWPGREIHLAHRVCWRLRRMAFL